MQTLIDFDDAPLFAIPTVGIAGGAHLREGMLIEGPQGWGEFSPLPDSDDDTCRRWLTAATEPGTVGWPDPLRGRIPAAVIVPAVDAAQAGAITAHAGCRTAQVTVAAAPDSLSDDIARVAAVREALGEQGAIRCVAQSHWDVDGAVRAIRELARAAGALEFIEQPCRTAEELAEVRRRIDVPLAVDIAVDAALQQSPASWPAVADIAVLRCGPLGGVRRSLRLAESSSLPCVVASSTETSIGQAAGVALAGALPELRFACALGSGTELAADLVAGPRSLVPVDGYLPVAPMPPGPAPELLERYAITDPERIRRWRSRLRMARS
ncbi:o-succinylbenzoate synthase [Mycolicibacterium thermoresistibile]